MTSMVPIYKGGHVPPSDALCAMYQCNSLCKIVSLPTVMIRCRTSCPKMTREPAMAPPCPPPERHARLIAKRLRQQDTADCIYRHKEAFVGFQQCLLLENVVACRSAETMDVVNVHTGNITNMIVARNIQSIMPAPVSSQLVLGTVDSRWQLYDIEASRRIHEVFLDYTKCKWSQFDHTYYACCRHGLVAFDSRASEPVRYAVPIQRAREICCLNQHNIVLVSGSKVHLWDVRKTCNRPVSAMEATSRIERLHGLEGGRMIAQTETGWQEMDWIRKQDQIQMDQGGPYSALCIHDGTVIQATHRDGFTRLSTVSKSDSSCSVSERNGAKSRKLMGKRLSVQDWTIALKDRWGTDTKLTDMVWNGGTWAAVSADGDMFAIHL